MTDGSGASIHASAVVIGERAVLIRGESGTGKSRLAFDLILAGRAGQIAETRLVADDRAKVRVRDGALIVEPVAELAGLIEVRGLGIRRCQFAAEAPVGLVIDLGASDSSRLPRPAALVTVIRGVEVARIPVPPGYSALPMVLAALLTRSESGHSSL
jgi:serine kinase of HPr protein (carbohydrate metabolism regulator)